MAKQNSRGVYIAAFVLLLGGLGYLVVTGLSQGATPTLKISQALTMEQADLMGVRLYGKVLAEGIALHEDGLGVAFIVADEADPGRGMAVDFRGAVPDTFKEGAEVILKGSIDKAENLFRATQMTTKCPSKYEEQRAEN